jgi:hypothetical protein
MNDTLLRVGRIDVTSDAEMTPTLSQVDALLAQLRSHIEHENRFVHAAIEARRPGGARGTADDHLEHFEHIQALGAEVAALRVAADDQRPLLALRLYRHLALFVAENFQHMHIEETANNAALWALYTDAELFEIHDRLVESIPPSEMMPVLRWMALTTTPQELAAVLGDMHSNAPSEVFRAVLAMMRPELEPRRWVQLTAALGVPAGNF